MHVKVASSFISFEQAELNLKRELANDAFELHKAKSQSRLEQTTEQDYGGRWHR